MIYKIKCDKRRVFGKCINDYGRVQVEENSDHRFLSRDTLLHPLWQFLVNLDL
jgi:hypothetical protein